uniref:Coiled-coil domain-containing protein 22 homolog n=1 Tax=Globisporangium ultimum (strain ATCC 200006 / CBS 805.95 / DAOM BR144) TaxID=431595 RepID=K3W524_GLOUD
MTTVWKCLAQLQNAVGSSQQLDFQLPASFAAPVGVAARHRVGSQLANILKVRDCGYNHFLYPSEKETRNILSWLVGKLPRTAIESNLEELSSINTLSSFSSGGSRDQAPSSLESLLTTESLQSIFSNWKQEKTLYVLPNREVKGLKGFQSLPLKTSPVQLPWSESQVNDTDKGGFLFDKFPEKSLKPVSLLEALASNRRCAMQKIGVFDDEDDLISDETREATKSHKSMGDASTGKNALEGTAQSAQAASDPLAFMTQTSFGDEDDEEDAAFSVGPLTEGKDSFGDDFAAALLSTASLRGTTVTTAPEGQLHAAESVPDVLDGQSEAELKAQAALSGVEISALSPAEEQELLEQMHTQLVDTKKRLTKMHKVIARDHAELVQVQQQIEDTKTRGIALKKQLVTRKQMLEMLPQAKENIAKLENICTTNEEKLQQLEAEWKAHCAPLLQEEAQLVAMKSNRKLRCRQFVTEMKTFREEMKTMAVAIQEKMDAMRGLDAMYAQLPQNLNRNMYTTRILEIIKQVHKQKSEIAKIIDDIKSIQKQLNFASEKLKRSEAVTEDKLFTAASGAVATYSIKETQPHPFVECYRKFADVRELFEELILVVSDVGKKENAARDLENWISQLQTRDSSRHLDKVLSDLQSVQHENSALMEQLRAATKA